MKEEQFHKLLEDYKQFVYSKLNKAEESDLLRLPKTEHTTQKKITLGVLTHLQRQRLFLQGAMGFIDEMEELRREINKDENSDDAYKELGDVLFYLTCIELSGFLEDRNPLFHGIAVGSLSLCTPLAMIEKLFVLLGLCKKLIFQTRYDLYEEISYNIGTVVMTIAYNYDCKTLEDLYEIFTKAINMNIEKLSKRYKKDFSIGESINRVE